MSRPPIPAAVKRQLRQESNFSCCLCRIPLLEYHHIVPWEERHHFEPEHMIALCPNHARRADVGVISRPQLYEAKRHPFNNSIVREDEFRLIGNHVSVMLGSNTYIDTPRILVIDELDLIGIGQEERYPLLNVVLIDRFNNWIGIIEENEWVFDRTAMWDFEYSARHLAVRSGPRDVALAIDLQKDLVKIRGKLFYNGFPVEISPDEVRYGGKNALTIRGSTFQNLAVGVKIGA